ncbi:YceI family protein [Pontibacter sp. JH31]|uniref:YceI family protein n=1 Tax=Pontibacter aquaedesilientis TaxID=2766980 RepID=A0ABR7XG92_9BACT|nr:YceI family protein [Pontibacter aquaedesilientis]MBD1396628.1 YceI family protein [Pontibacter aquaedesilientis]
MKLYLLTLLFLLTAFSGVKGQDLYYAKKVETGFFSEARFENIEAASNAGISVLNTRSGEIAFKIPIRSFVFANGLMQEHFNETYLESDKYPNATFSGKLVERIDFAIPGSYPVKATGTLTVHGVPQKRTIAGTVQVLGNSIVLTANFLVPVADHEIDIPKDKLSNISQEIKINLKASYEPKK